MEKDMLDEVYFPHENAREHQDALVMEAYSAIKERKSMLVHAPTGIGKTASVLAPALSVAMKKGLTVFFLTSRHTQHKIAIDTLKQIKKRHGIKFSVADIIGKKWMCLQPAANIMNSADFADYCKSLREESKCEFYTNTRKKSRAATVSAEKVLMESKELGPYDIGTLKDECEKQKLCPYEMAAIIGKDAHVIVADYYYIFSPSVRDSLFSRIEKKLEECIIIVDEAHNLPSRIRDLMTAKLSNNILERALKEAKKFKFSEAAEMLISIKGAIDDLSRDLSIDKEEKLIDKEDFTGLLKKDMDYGQIVSELEDAGDDIREAQKHSYTGSVAKFLQAWLGQDEGFARIISKRGYMGRDLVTVSYRCLDPSMVSRDIIKKSHSTIMMSGTLNPTFMYKDILGFEHDAIERELENPFPENNRLNIIIPETTTKFTRRNKEEFGKIADICSNIVNRIPGCTAIFFPSYLLRDSIYNFFNGKCKKTMFLEKPRMTKEEKEGMIERFKGYKKHGAVLLGVASGSFGEGIDMPGVLKCVIVAGLPLQKPDLETKELIDYYEKKFGKGFDYGYVIPALTKSLQNAGRCIRSEKDHGIIIFLDERFAWQNYYKFFPKDMDFKISRVYESRIEDFFSQKAS
ncbi:ATP-dependent DNA helicase [Candidatus Woesearchaeota archaeon]|nr:ATP-dependent DNA helicase [Candidatus Woesearchaeota archaeon]